MFSPFMINAWEASTIVAVVAGVVGFFTVLRGSSFAAHALPNGALRGSCRGSLIGASTILGLGVFSLLGAIGIASLGRRARHDVATALAIVVMLGLGSLFLSMTTEYAPEIFSLLFGEVLGVASNELLPTAAIGVVCVVAIAVLYRPLLLSSVMPDVARIAWHQGIADGDSRSSSWWRSSRRWLFPWWARSSSSACSSRPAAAARSFTNKPLTAMGLSVVYRPRDRVVRHRPLLHVESRRSGSSWGDGRRDLCHQSRLGWRGAAAERRRGPDIGDPLCTLWSKRRTDGRDPLSAKACLSRFPCRHLG